MSILEPWIFFVPEPVAMLLLSARAAAVENDMDS